MALVRAASKSKVTRARARRRSRTWAAAGVSPTTFPVKRRSPGAAAVACVSCRRPTDEPRKGQCMRCYLAAYNGRQKGAACSVCCQSDPRVLVRRTVAGVAGTTLCANCSTILGRRPLTLEQLRTELRAPGDRRLADQRTGRDRRAGERREGVSLERLLGAELERRAGGRRAVDESATAAAAELLRPVHVENM